KEDTTPVYAINAARGRNDDGNETTATWKAAQKPAWSQPMDTTFRYRWRLQELTGIDDTARAPTFEVYKDFFDNNFVTTTAAICKFVSSANVTDNEVTTQQLSGGFNSFVAGNVNENDA